MDRVWLSYQLSTQNVSIKLYRLHYKRHIRETLEDKTEEIFIWVALRQSEKLYLAPFCGILIWCFTDWYSFVYNYLIEWKLFKTQKICSFKNSCTCTFFWFILDLMRTLCHVASVFMPVEYSMWSNVPLFTFTLALFFSYVT